MKPVKWAAIVAITLAGVVATAVCVVLGIAIVDKLMGAP